MTARSVLLTGFLVSLVSSCSGMEPSTPPREAVPSSEPTVATAQEQEFELAVSVARTAVRAGDEIAVEGTLTYVGTRARVDLTASGSGLVNFGIEEIDGERKMRPAVTADCAPYTLLQGKPAAHRFKKSGGYDPDDPKDAFWRQYFADPVLRLPPGRWRLFAISEFNTGGCGGQRHYLEASVEITVVP